MTESLSPDLEAAIARVRRIVISYWLRHGRYQDAEDLAHDGLVHCWVKRQKWAEMTGKVLVSYLVTTAIRPGIDELRKEARRETLRLEHFGRNSANTSAASSSETDSEADEGDGF